MMTKPTASFPVSRNVAEMKASSTLAAMQAADSMRAAGVDVVDLGAGEIRGQIHEGDRDEKHEHRDDHEHK